MSRYTSIIFLFMCIGVFGAWSTTAQAASPQITVVQSTVAVDQGDGYDPMLTSTCYDDEDGQISGSDFIADKQITSSTAVGNHIVTLSCVDSDANVSHKEIVVIVGGSLPSCSSQGGVAVSSGPSACYGGTVVPSSGLAEGDVCCILPSCGGTFGGSCVTNAEQAACTSAGGTVNAATDCNTTAPTSPYCCIPSNAAVACTALAEEFGTGYSGTCTPLGSCTAPNATQSASECSAGSVCCYDPTQAAVNLPSTGTANPAPSTPGYGGFVPCEGAGCSACDFVSMANTILVWLIGLLFVVFAVIAAVAGFGMVTSGGNPQALSDAKAKMMNAVVGIVIVLAAWLLVDTVMRGLLKGGEGKIDGFALWSEVKCQVQTPVGPGTTPPVVDLATDCSGTACVSLADASVPCKDQNSCSVAASLQPKLAAFHTAAGVSGARVTEAMPPTYNHMNLCHANGTCIDYSVAGGITDPEDVKKIINAAVDSGLRPMYEVGTQAEVDAMISAGVPAEYIERPLGDHITAPHFSIYE